MKLSTIACIALPILGISMLVILVWPVLTKTIYVTPEVERAYEALKTPEERAAFDRTIQEYNDRIERQAQLRLEQDVAIKAMDAISEAHKGPTPTEAQQQVAEDRRHTEESIAARAHIRQIEEQAQAEQAEQARLLQQAMGVPTPTPTPSIIVVNGPMTKEQIHALINGPK